jgi:uncharacterized membrane protein
MAAYNNAIPNGADRIMKMAELQQGHRHKLEAEALATENWKSRFGMGSGLSIVLTAIAGTSLIFVLTLLYGVSTQQIVAGLIGGSVLTGSVLVSLVRVFLRVDAQVKASDTSAKAESKPKK